MEVSGGAGRELIARSETLDRWARWSDMQQSKHMGNNTQKVRSRVVGCTVLYM